MNKFIEMHDNTYYTPFSGRDTLLAFHHFTKGEQTEANL